MKALIQRVTQASVAVDGRQISSIGPGLLVLLGIERDDTEAQARQLVDKVVSYRVFDDAEGKMNLGLVATGGALLVVSQFTLVAQTNKGLRPGFSKGANPEQGLALYQRFVAIAREKVPSVETGKYGANMEVALVNKGPATFMLQV